MMETNDTMPPPEGPQPPGETIDIDAKKIPPSIIRLRAQIRAMMVERCRLPGCVIPKGYAIRAADWVTMLATFRAYARGKGRAVVWADDAQLRHDIAGAASAVEMVFMVMTEEVQGEQQQIEIAQLVPK